MKKKWLWLIGLGLLVPAVAAFGCARGPTTVETLQLNNQQSGIWVSGQGEVTVVPDVAILRLGIEAQETTVAAAQADAAAAMENVRGALLSNGIAEKDIQTQRFSINQIRRWDEFRQIEVVTGYRVTNTVTAKVRNVEAAGAVIDAVATAGGDLTRIDGISFAVDDPSAYHSEAREKAMADAAAKAGQLAELAGVRLGKPTYVAESVQVPSPIYPRIDYSAAPAPGFTETSISPGELDITLTVQVAYDIID